MSEYTVYAADCVGFYAERHVDTLGEAAAEFRRLRDANRGYYGYYVGVVRNDYVDLGCNDGLTSDQREWFENEVEAPGENGEAPR
jgi:hypothetical protein